MDRHPLHSSWLLRPEQVEHLLTVVLDRAPDTLKETSVWDTSLVPVPAKLLQCSATQVVETQTMGT